MSLDNDTTALRMSAAAAFHRLGQLAGSPGRLHVDAAPNALAVLEDEARVQGWELVPPGEADFILRIGPRVPVSPPHPSFEVVVRLPHRTHLTLNAWFARHPWASRIPLRWRHRIATAWNTWGLDERVGSRIASLPCPENEELYLVRRGTPVRRSSGMSASDRVRDLVATCGGLGHVPLAGATLASLWPVLVAYATWWALPTAGDFRLVWGGVAFLASAGCLATERWAQRHYFAHDPREVVMDETAGMALTLLFLPDALRGASAGTVAATFALAFLALRFFDVFKLGVRWIDRRSDLPGGVLWDDLLAGVYAGLVTAALAGLLPGFP